VVNRYAKSGQGVREIWTMGYAKSGQYPYAKSGQGVREIWARGTRKVVIAMIFKV